jgi:hypothetical protein
MEGTRSEKDWAVVELAAELVRYLNIHLLYSGGARRHAWRNVSLNTKQISECMNIVSLHSKYINHNETITIRLTQTFNMKIFIFMLVFYLGLFST